MTVITDDDRVDLVHRRNLPTSAFTLRKPQVVFIEEESRRRGISKSALIREFIDRHMIGDTSENERLAS